MLQLKMNHCIKSTILHEVPHSSLLALGGLAVCARNLQQGP